MRARPEWTRSRSRTRAGARSPSRRAAARALLAENRAFWRHRVALHDAALTRLAK